MAHDGAGVGKSDAPEVVTRYIHRPFSESIMALEYQVDLPARAAGSNLSKGNGVENVRASR